MPGAKVGKNAKVEFAIVAENTTVGDGAVIGSGEEIDEAGGKITDWNGNPVPLFGSSSVAVSNGHLHSYLLSTLQANAKFPI